MSVSKSTYVILGYDFTSIQEQLIPKDWFWTKEGEEFVNNQVKGNIQFFNDPMSGEHLYFGYIVSVSEDYDGDVVTKVTIGDLENKKQFVDAKLTNSGLSLIRTPIPYGMIVFNEYY